MTTWHEAFDNQAALAALHLRARRLTKWYGLGSLGLALGAPLVIAHVPGGPWLAATAAALLVASSVAVVRALRALYAVTWCVRLSVHGLVADFGRRRMAMRWQAVARVELDDAGLVVVGTDEKGVARRLRLSYSFPDYAGLSHRVVAYAEAHKRPVWVDGRPWQLLDIGALYPFLQSPVREA